MSNYLLEIGVEELPYKFIPSAIHQLKSIFENFFNENSLNFNSVNVYATPRRLAVLVYGLDNRQSDSEKIIKGPVKSIAYNPDGSLSKAGIGFATKNNVTEKELFIVDNYVFAKILSLGKSTADIISANVPDLLLKLQGSHFMRWANNDEKFSRPIRWIVSLLDNQEVKITLFNVTSSKISHGHRFSKLNTVQINSPEEYVQKLKSANVFVNQDERKNIIKNLIKTNADKLNAYPDYDDELLNEVTYICEYPVAVVCDFDDKYLKIPQKVAVTVMEVHQRYFALYRNGKLINKFITVTNFVGDNFDNIKSGNLRVIKARLDDAVFFYNEDTKKPLASFRENLKGITFQKGMGSLFDKSVRLVALSSFIADKLKLDKTNIIKVAELCKADLATNLVFEFTELQGFIGADYAKVSGENTQVALGIKEHYFPLNADSDLASAIEGQIVGIADKLDTTCAVFASGKNPTGSSDPLGIRRAVLGIIKTVLDKNLSLNLSEMIEFALNQLPIKSDCLKQINDFFIQRLIIYLSETYNKSALEACSNINPLLNLSDFLNRVTVVSNINDKTLIESAVRVSKILKIDSNSIVKPELFKDKEEIELYNAVIKITPCKDYSDYLKNLISLNPAVTNFFEKVLVNDKNEEIKQNRMGLLKILKQKYEVLADFSKL